MRRARDDGDAMGVMIGWAEQGTLFCPTPLGTGNVTREQEMSLPTYYLLAVEH